MNSRERRKQEAELHNYQRWLMINAPQSQRFELAVNRRRPSEKNVLILGAMAGFGAITYSRY